MRTVGRIILLLIAAALLGTSIPIIKTNWELLSQAGWTDFNTYPERWTALSAIVATASNFFFGVIALIGAIRGRMSLKLLIASIIMFAPVAWFFYNATVDGSIQNVEVMIEAAIGFAMPIGYFIGSLMLLKRK